MSGSNPPICPERVEFEGAHAPDPRERPEVCAGQARPAGRGGLVPFPVQKGGGSGEEVTSCDEAKIGRTLDAGEAAFVLCTRCREPLEVRCPSWRRRSYPPWRNSLGPRELEDEVPGPSCSGSHRESLGSHPGSQSLPGGQRQGLTGSDSRGVAGARPRWWRTLSAT